MRKLIIFFSPLKTLIGYLIQVFGNSLIQEREKTVYFLDRPINEYDLTALYKTHRAFIIIIYPYPHIDSLTYVHKHIVYATNRDQRQPPGLNIIIETIVNSAIY